MSIADLGSLGEFFASFGVLATLIILILQVRQNTAQMKLRTELDRSSVIVDAGVALMGDNAHKAFTKAVCDPSILEDSEIMQVWAYLDIFLASVHATWNSYTRGMCDEDEWINAKATAQVAFSFPVGMVIWGELKRYYPHAMTEQIEAYIDEHGIDRAERRFKGMLNSVRQLESASN